MKSVHLLVCIHGLWGNPDHLQELSRILKEKYTPHDDAAPNLDILVANSNRGGWTYDGIDWGAKRIADEVQEHIAHLEKEGIRKVTCFSVIGYSLGGLVARYMLGIFESQNFFRDVTPCNFITIATPHVGLAKYPGFLSVCFNAFSPRLISRSGKQLSFLDKSDPSGRPLLEILADKDQVFFLVLSRFRRIEIYANAVKDGPVPYLTGAIELEDPFFSYETNGLRIELDEGYEPMIKSFEQAEPSPNPPRRFFSWDFLRSMKPTPLLIPVPVPVQLILWLFVPILLPLLMVVIIVRLALDSRASKARLKDLESGGTGDSTFVNVLRAVEQRTDDTIADFIDKPTPTSPSHSSTKQSRAGPSLSPNQRAMVESLNSLPQMRKHLAFITGVLNSHAVIVCRDVEGVWMHKRGAGVLHHLADNFVV